MQAQFAIHSKILMVTLWCGWLFHPATVAGELNDQKKALIDELATFVSAADDEDLEDKLRAYLQARILLPVKGTTFADDPILEKIVTEEVDAVVREEIDSGVSAANHRIYHHYLTAAELQELVAFYRTPTGQKALMLLPEILIEAKNARHQWGRSLQSLIEQRVNARFEREHPASKDAK